MAKEKLSPLHRPKLEIADIFRAQGHAWRLANAGHVSLSQLKVMSAIEACRTEALGGHVAGCTKCGHHHIAYNSSQYILTSGEPVSQWSLSTFTQSFQWPRRS